MNKFEIYIKEQTHKGIFINKNENDILKTFSFFIKNLFEKYRLLIFLIKI